MKIIGHRGARHEAPENTVEGFIWAQQHGCEHFELDIQLSRDHELMVFHDTTLHRTTGLRGRMASVSSRALTSIDARRGTPGWFMPARIPTLKDVIACAPHCKTWQFEVKTDSRHRLNLLAQKLARFIHTHKLTPCAYVTSSDRWFLHHFKRLYAGIATGYVAEWSIPDPVTTALKLECDILCMNDALASSNRVAAAKEAGLDVSVWTVNKLTRMDELATYGVDSVITDIPSIALEHFPA